MDMRLYTYKEWLQLGFEPNLAQTANKNFPRSDVNTRMREDNAGSGMEFRLKHTGVPWTYVYIHTKNGYNSALS
jgi:hypothetical protein